MNRLIYGLPAFLLLAMLSGCNNYGKEKTYNGVELYHTDNVTDAESESLGSFLVAQKFADGNDKTVQLAKSGSTYQFRFVVKPGSEKDQNTLKTFKYFASILSAQVFNGARVEVDMCDDNLKTIKTFTSEELGKIKTFNALQLYYTKAVTDAEVDSLSNFLIRSKFANGVTKSAQIAKSGNTYQFRLVVKKGADSDVSYQKNAKDYGKDMSADVFHGAPVEVDLCDEFLNTLIALPMGADSTKQNVKTF